MPTSGSIAVQQLLSLASLGHFQGNNLTVGLSLLGRY